MARLNVPEVKLTRTAFDVWLMTIFDLLHAQAGELPSLPKWTRTDLGGTAHSSHAPCKAQVKRVHMFGVGQL